MISQEDAIRFATYPNELKLHLSGINDASNRAWASVEMGALEHKGAGNEGPSVREWMDRNDTGAMGRSGLKG